MPTEKPEECTGCGTATTDLEMVDLHGTDTRYGEPWSNTYAMAGIQWWCPYCMVIPIRKRYDMVIPIRKRYDMEPDFNRAAMFNVLERRLRASGGESEDGNA